MSVMEIDSMQLENLLAQNVGFLFLDLRNEVSQDPVTERLMSQATRVAPSEVKKVVEEKATDKSAPVVLVCESGEGSRQMAEELAGLGYINICYLEQGAKGIDSGHH